MKESLSSPLQSSRVFDHIAIASGFFSDPYIPSVLNLDRFKEHGEIYHSSNYQEHFLTEEKWRRSKRVVVVGGSQSAVEVVSDFLLRQGSSDLTEVIHVFPRPFWILPRHLPMPSTDSKSPLAFIPLDFVLLDGYSWRDNQKNAEGITGSLEHKNMQFNEIFKGLVGNGDQSSLSPLLKIGPEEMKLPPYTSITDSYTNFVRSGDVQLQRGYVSSILCDPLTGQWNCLEISHNPPSVHSSNTESLPKESTQFISDVDMIIFATGYTATHSLASFFPQQVLQSLSYRANDNFLPLLLDNQILHRSFITYAAKDNPSENDTVHAGFIGMYRGPYFGVVESQAKYLARLFQGSIKPPPQSTLDKQLAAIRTMRDGRDSGKLELRGQWSFPDHVGTMKELEELMQETQGKKIGKSGVDIAIEYSKLESISRIAPVIPAHFAPKFVREAQESITSLSQILKEAVQGTKFLAKAVFRSLQGSWKLIRTLNSRLKEMPSGTFVGTAKFHPRRSTFHIALPMNPDSVAELTCSVKRTQLAYGHDTTDNLSASNDIIEYIYSEYGTFTLSTPPYISFPATRKYIYRYQPGSDSISVWFVKNQSGPMSSMSPPSRHEEMEGEVDYLFHEVEFLKNEENRECIAKGKEHLCVEDLYNTRYRFRFGELGNTSSNPGAEIHEFSIEYNVCGPKKDYTSEGRFERV